MSKYTLLIFTFITIILILVIGCSKGTKRDTPTSGDLTGIETGDVDQGNDIFRKLAAWEEPEQLLRFSVEGFDDYETKLVDCVAATVAYVDATHYWNYVLACDTKGKWASTPSSFSRGCIYVIPMNDSDNPTYCYGRAMFPGTYIKDPDACDLIAIEIDDVWQLHAFTFDGDDGVIEHFWWEIDTDYGTLSSFTPDNSINISGNDHASGIAVTPAFDDENLHIFVCDPVDKAVYVRSIEYDGEEWDLDPFFNITLDDFSPDIPVDVCITRYDNCVGYDPLCWTAYIAIQDSEDRDMDYIHCYHWGGSDYSSNNVAVGMSTTDYFPCIIDLDVQKVGADSDDDNNYAPEDQHWGGSVCVLMKQENMKKYTMRQVNFYSIDNEDRYYQFEEEFDEDYTDAGIYPESFALCRLQYGTSPEHVGNKYIIGDRDPDMNAGNPDDPEDHGENLYLYMAEKTD